eukprot:GHVP01053969.1.p1 GENE.GHVP01053969.1~~GHVP01053969.1.p1  ORF type:complete len:789 (-),score=122.89 GHVP01053969.1:621-2987(-)
MITRMQTYLPPLLGRFHYLYQVSDVDGLLQNHLLFLKHARRNSLLDLLLLSLKYPRIKQNSLPLNMCRSTYMEDVNTNIRKAFVQLERHLGGFDLTFLPEITHLTEETKIAILQLVKLFDYKECLEISMASIHLIQMLCSTNKEISNKLCLFLAPSIKDIRKDISTRLRMEDMSNKRPTPTEIIRLQIMDMLNEGLEQGTFGLVYYILGVDESLFYSPENPLYQKACLDEIKGEGSVLQTLIELSLYGLAQEGHPIVFDRHPVFGEKIYKFFKLMTECSVTEGITKEYMRATGFIQKHLERMSPEIKNKGNMESLIAQVYYKGVIFKIAAEEVLSRKRSITDGETVYSLGEAKGSLMSHIIEADAVFTTFLHDSLTEAILAPFYCLYLGWTSLIEVLTTLPNVKEKSENVREGLFIMNILADFVFLLGYPMQIVNLLIKTILIFGTTFSIPSNFSVQGAIDTISVYGKDEEYRKHLYMLLCYSDVSKNDLSDIVRYAIQDITCQTSTKACVQAAQCLLIKHSNKIQAIHFKGHLLNLYDALKKSEELLINGLDTTSIIFMHFHMIKILIINQEIKEFFFSEGLVEFLSSLQCWDRKSELYMASLLSYVLDILTEYYSSSVYRESSKKTESTNRIKTLIAEHSDKLTYNTKEELILRTRLFSDPLLSIGDIETLKKVIKGFWRSVAGGLIIKNIGEGMKQEDVVLNTFVCEQEIKCLMNVDKLCHFELDNEYIREKTIFAEKCHKRLFELKQYLARNKDKTKDSQFADKLQLFENAEHTINMKIRKLAL